MSQKASLTKSLTECWVFRDSQDSQAWTKAGPGSHAERRATQQRPEASGHWQRDCSCCAHQPPLSVNTCCAESQHLMSEGLTFVRCSFSTQQSYSLA